MWELLRFKFRPKMTHRGNDCRGQQTQEDSPGIRLAYVILFLIGVIRQRHLGNASIRCFRI